MSDSIKKPQLVQSPAPELETTAEDFVKFLKDSTSKGAMKDFILETYRQFEAKRVAEFKARLENEQRVDDNRIADFHTPGNIEPLVSEILTMNETEHAFARGLKATKSSLVRSAEERVEEIHRLLAGIGGFCSQLRSCFARSTVVFLEQEDPRRSYRERLVFSINLPSYELKQAWNRGGKDTPAPTDGRTAMQATWDSAVNALAQIIASTGLKPKYCKNDRHFGRFVMKQDLRHASNLPDEYFSFTLDYNTTEKIEEMKGPYNRIVAKYDKGLARMSKRLDGYDSDSSSGRYHELRRRYLALLSERDHFLGTTPDPNQLQEGLLFLIEVSTLKDYHIVKDRMQTIMTQYILHLSKIAAEDARVDPELHHEIKRLENQARVRPLELPSQDESIQEYEIDTKLLKPIRKDKKAA